ncbi:hypothetical protein [Cohnella rhizosphaerae]|uniref:Uncharacterized protein n=1 Tax=Cohnella rhizosphaerae TaxID=1457232 RepID=A0A9X4L324_9BACL|nr:hypothetical protein [Cohnella rhizosphaerae]MDG0812739.1 hypothetical protein [Cohnella rhizosphaerae]
MARMMRLFNRANRYSLANQLVFSFLIIFLFIFTISSLFAYVGIMNVLKKKRDRNESTAVQTKRL